ncbi:MAG: class I SAM-dependent methyltransferase [Oscillospiraceae bacterium]|nr:class I SAM-dependent methyltransferase [Oscillospiraceae bacterium]
MFAKALKGIETVLTRILLTTYVVCGLSNLALKHVLDIPEIGCGDGANVVQLPERCMDETVIGMDYSEVSVEKRKSVNAKVMT